MQGVGEGAGTWIGTPQQHGGRMALPADTVHGSKGDTRVGHVVRVKVRSHITS